MALWENAIGYGTHAARPAPGAVGALYFESDTGNGYRDNGTGWDLIVPTPAPAGGVLTPRTAGTTSPIPAADSLTMATASGITLTLPSATTSAGHMIAVVNPPSTGALITIAAAAGQQVNAGSSTTVNGGDGLLLISDGSNWWGLGFY